MSKKITADDIIIEFIDEGNLRLLNDHSETQSMYRRLTSDHPDAFKAKDFCLLIIDGVAHTAECSMFDQYDYYNFYDELDDYDFSQEARNLLNEEIPSFYL